MHIVTDRIFPDEPSYGISEMPRLRKMDDGSEQWRWVQQVYVVRGDAIAKYETDYGPAERFVRIQPFAMPSFGDDSVAQLQEFAEKNRHDDYWAKRSDEMLAESTLIRDHLNQVEIDKAEIRNRSVIGPAISVQRNDYSQERLRRIIKERTHA